MNPSSSLSPPCIEKGDIFETEIQPIEVNGTETKNESKIPPNMCPQDDQKAFLKSLRLVPLENLSGNFDSTKVFENFNNAYGDMVMEFKNMVVKQKVYEKEINAKNEVIDVLKKSQAQSEFEIEQNRKKWQKDITKFKNIQKKVKKEIETYWNSEVKSKFENLSQKQLDLKAIVSSKNKEISQLKISIDNLRSVDSISKDLRNFNSDDIKNLKLQVNQTVDQFSKVKEKYRNLVHERDELNEENEALEISNQGK